MQLILIGFQKSGKTTIGKKVAHFLNIPFFDIDELILQETKIEAIRQVYKLLGEKQFRVIETKMLNSLPMEPAIIATGGGTPIVEENRILLKMRGKVIYLKTKPEILYNRLFEKGVPLYLNPQDPKMHFFELFEQRSFIYTEMAQEILCMDDLNEESAAFKLTKMYGK